MKASSFWPSRKFTKFIIFGFLFGAIIFFGVNYFFGKNGTYTSKNSLTANSATVGDLTQKDTNENGIADWEETLWGLDPTADGKKNQEIIYLKKQDAGDLPSSGTSSGDGQLNETDIFARDFITTVSALKTSGNLNQTSIENLSQQVAQEIGTKDTIDDIYVENDLKVVPENYNSRIKYALAFKKVIDSYGKINIGSELALLESYFKTGDKKNLTKLKEISDGYKNFSGDLMKMEVPTDNSANHLLLANTFAKLAISVSNIAQIDGNTLVGMIGMSQYQNIAPQASEAMIGFQYYFK